MVKFRYLHRLNVNRMIAVVLTILSFNLLHSQSKPSHYRGLCIAQDNSLWISGTKGVVLKKNQIHQDQFDTLKTGFPRKDFRDIWAMDQKVAVAMSISDSAVIIKTTNGGESWQLVYANNEKGIFLDVIEIDPCTGIGLVLGDPMIDVNGRRYFKGLFTNDYGSTWMDILNGSWNVPTDTIESIFAASGKSLRLLNTQIYRQKNKYDVQFVFGGGGNEPNMHMIDLSFSGDKQDSERWNVVEVETEPFHLKGGDGWGCYSMEIGITGPGVAVGGNYGKVGFTGDSSGAVASFSKGIFKKWQPSILPPSGYRSGVCLSGDVPTDTIWRCFFEGISANEKPINMVFGSDFKISTLKKTLKYMAICTGTNGTDISFDGGKKWFPLEIGKGYNSCEFYQGGVVFVGNRGAVEIVDFKSLGKRFQRVISGVN